MVPDKVRQQEADALKSLYETHAKGLKHGAFGKTFAIGTAGMVWQCLNNHRPLSLAVASKFSVGLGVPIDAFSPRLGQQARKAMQQTSGSALVANEAAPGYSAWPFTTVRPEQYSRLSKLERDSVEGLALKYVVEREGPPSSSAAA
ncbi:MAG TPA: hypothetical protein PKY40_04210 [Burkholderiaceae bacterium]|nr:hypothetical protein [Burkholderiaceae bacterium]